MQRIKKADCLNVESRYRCIANVVAFFLIVAGCMYMSSRVFTIATNKSPPAEVTVSSEWGTFPNIWLCAGRRGQQIKPTQSTYRILGEGLNGFRSVPRSERTFTSELLKAYIGYSCAVYEFSTITDEEATSVEIQMMAEPPAGSSSNYINILAHSLPDPDTNSEEWLGEIGAYEGAPSHHPFQYCSLRKDYVGFKYLFSQEVQARYDCPSKGTSKEGDKINIMFEVRRSDVEYRLKQSQLRQCLELFASAGGIISVMSTIFGIFFVTRFPKALELTLRGHEVHDEEDGLAKPRTAEAEVAPAWTATLVGRSPELQGKSSAVAVAEEGRDNENPRDCQ